MHVITVGCWSDGMNACTYRKWFLRNDAGEIIAQMIQLHSSGIGLKGLQSMWTSAVQLLRLRCCVMQAMLTNSFGRKSAAAAKKAPLLEQT